MELDNIEEKVIFNNLISFSVQQHKNVFTSTDM